MLQTCLWLHVKQAFSIGSHTMQLAMEDDLKIPSYQKVLAHVGRLISHFSRSTNQAALTDQVKNGMTNPLLPIQGIATSWNSQIMMAERLSLLKLPVLTVLFNSSVTKPADRSALHLSQTA